jgi:hypothetical protein
LLLRRIDRLEHLVKFNGPEYTPARSASLFAALCRFDNARPSLPGEHWAAFGLGVYLLLRPTRTAVGRVASLVAGGVLVARALSGRDGAIALWRRAERRDAEGELVDVAMPWPYDDPVRIARTPSGEE